MVGKIIVGSCDGLCQDCGSDPVQQTEVSTIAGQVGVSGSTDGIGTAASFARPYGIASIGTDLYVADRDGNTIRKIDMLTNAVTTIAGTGWAGSADGTGTAASFFSPFEITAVGTDLYVLDRNNHLVRKLSLIHISEPTRPY